MKQSISLFVLLIILSITSLHAFKDGEKLTFDIKYGLVTAGQAVLETKSITFNNIPAWRITSDTQTNTFFDKLFKVRDHIESIWQKENLISLKFSKQMNEGNYRQHRIHLYFPKQKTSTYNRYNFKKKTWRERTISIPDNTQDIFSAFYLARLQHLDVNKPLIINVTTDGKSHKAKVLVLRKERINTIFGNVECLVIKPDLLGEAIFKQSGEILIWITNDEHKIPVKMESKVIFGSFKAILTNASNVGLKVVNE